MTNLPKDHPQVLLSQYKEIAETASDTIEDFIYFVDNFDGVFEEIFENREEEDKFFVILNKFTKKFLMEDEKSQTILKRAEQTKLNDWIKSVKGK